MKTLFIPLVALLMVSCSKGPKPEPVKPESIARGAEICKLAPSTCEQSCAACADKAACFANGGECKTISTGFNDTGDIGADIWTPGCHFQYPDLECVNGDFVDGDACSTENPKVLIEWTLSTCHPPNGDREAFDCDKECLRAQRGNGTCVVVSNACSGKPSAFCKCDKPPPFG